jgi:transcriptional regulator with XRE-family HTH domain
MPRRHRRNTRFSGRYLRFLKLLREARLNAGLTQSQTAKRIGQPQSFVAKCEAGERRVDIIELIAFCRTYRIEPAKFIRRLGRPK